MVLMRQKTMTEPKLCSATIQGEPCGRPVQSLGFCSAHYQRQRDGRDMDSPFKRMTNVGVPCSGTVDGQPCEKEVVANGMCEGHRARHRTNRDMDSPWQVLLHRILKLGGTARFHIHTLKLHAQFSRVCKLR